MIKYCAAEKNLLKHRQALTIVAEAEKLSPEEFYNCAVHLDRETEDILQRCYVQLQNKIYDGMQDKWILDVGCGLGPFTLRMESYGHTVVGLDLYKAKINFCQRLKDAFPTKRFWFHEGTAYRMPFFDQWFDVAHTTMVIEHLQDPLTGLQEIGRVAKLVTGIIHMGKDKDESPLHQYFYKPQDVLTLLDACFADYEIYWLDGNVCAIFAGTPRVGLPLRLGQEYAEKMITTLMHREIQIKSFGPERVPIAKIARQAHSRMDIVEDYLACLQKNDLSLFESPILPIRLVYIPWADTYQVFGDGVHRVAALHLQENIKTVRAMVTRLEGQTPVEKFAISTQPNQWYARSAEIVA